MINGSVDSFINIRFTDHEWVMQKRNDKNAARGWHEIIIRPHLSINFFNYNMLIKKNLLEFFFISIHNPVKKINRNRLKCYTLSCKSSSKSINNTIQKNKILSFSFKNPLFSVTNLKFLSWLWRHSNNHLYVKKFKHSKCSIYMLTGRQKLLRLKSKYFVNLSFLILIISRIRMV